MIPPVMNLSSIEFDKNASKTFSDLLSDNDFKDVTLACNNNQQIKAYKVILSSGSTFFRTVLTNNPHQHPLLYLKGIEYEDLEAILKFVYTGQAEVEQFHLERFMKAGKDLEITNLFDRDEGISTETVEETVEFKEKLEKDFVDESGIDSHLMQENEASESSIHKTNMADESNEDNTIVNVKIERIAGPNSAYDYPCNQCDYTATTKPSLRRHRDSKHEGITYSCDKCERTFAVKDNLRIHAKRVHEGKRYPCNACDSILKCPSSLSRHRTKNHKLISGN